MDALKNIAAKIGQSVYNCLKGIFALSIIFRIVALSSFTTYDMKCFIFENASIVECQQSGLVSHPESWIIVFFLLSIVNSISFCLIVYHNRQLLNFQNSKAKDAYKNGSFISFFLLFGVTTGYYIYRCSVTKSSRLGLTISALLCIWPTVVLLVVCCFNFTPRVKLRCEGSCSEWFMANNLFFFYWSALVIYFLEVTCLWFAVALDATHEVAPLIEKRFPSNSLSNRPIHMLFLGFTLAFYSKALSFFWRKLFHGNGDLFYLIYRKLVPPQIEPQSLEQRVSMLEEWRQSMPSSDHFNENKVTNLIETVTDSIIEIGKENPEEH